MEGTLGGTVRMIRKKQKMTLEKLAKETDLSISFLSQLERGRSSATLNSLKKISLALEVNPGIFFEDTYKEKTKEEALNERGRIDNQFVYQDLSNGFVHPAFLPMLIILKPGENKGESFSHGGQEFLYVLKGILILEIEEKIHELQTHESIMFDSAKNHYWYNFTKEEVQFLCVAYDA